MKFILRHLNFWVRLLIVAGILLVGNTCLQHFRGNSRIEFYGRAVDEQQNSVSGVMVDFEVIYSDSIAIPLSYGRAEQTKKISVISDNDGNFHLGPTYGYSVRIVSFSRNDIFHDVFSGSNPPYRGGWLDTPEMKEELPDTPQKRITYTLRSTNDMRAGSAMTLQ